MAVTKGMCEALATGISSFLQQHPRCKKVGVRAKLTVDPRFLKGKKALRELELGRAEEGDDFGTGYDITVEAVWHGHRQAVGVFIPAPQLARGLNKKALVLITTVVIQDLNAKEVLRQQQDGGLLN